VNETIINIIKELVEDDTIIIDENTPLIGENSLLDSMNIVNLCIRLEDIANDQNFNFDWSGETMSKSKSMFRTVGSLAEEFLKQKNS
jgi:acyl carrier protein|tara:strand:- start:2693 stop:2953 length:261 start_codon:yes stop_codon:yes gene_type:complete